MCNQKILVILLCIHPETKFEFLCESLQYENQADIKLKGTF